MSSVPDAVVEMDLLTAFRVKYLLYGPAVALAAMFLQHFAVDLPSRDDQPAAAPASVQVDPQLTDNVQQAAIDRRPPESIEAAELDDLLTRARHQIEALALTSPPGNNAFETLQRVLGAIPSQPDALQGIKDIARKYAILAAQADKRGERDLAKRYLDKGLRLAPDHSDLLAVEKRLAEEVAFDRGPSAQMRADHLRNAPIRPVGTTR